MSNTSSYCCSDIKWVFHLKYGKLFRHKGMRADSQHVVEDEEGHTMILSPAELIYFHDRPEIKYVSMPETPDTGSALYDPVTGKFFTVYPEITGGSQPITIAADNDTVLIITDDSLGESVYSHYAFGHRLNIIKKSDKVFWYFMGGGYRGRTASYGEAYEKVQELVANTVRDARNMGKPFSEQTKVGTTLVHAFSNEEFVVIDTDPEKGTVSIIGDDKVTRIIHDDTKYYIGISIVGTAELPEPDSMQYDIVSEGTIYNTKYQIVFDSHSSYYKFSVENRSEFENDFSAYIHAGPSLEDAFSDVVHYIDMLES